MDRCWIAVKRKYAYVELTEWNVVPHSSSLYVTYSALANSIFCRYFALRPVIFSDIQYDLLSKLSVRSILSLL